MWPQSVLPVGAPRPTEADASGGTSSRDSASSASSLSEQIDPLLQTFRKELLTAFDGDAKAAAEPRHEPAVAAAEMRQLQAELDRARADCAEERRRRVQAEAQVHDAASTRRSTLDGREREMTELRLALAAAEARHEADAEQILELQALLRQREAELGQAKQQCVEEKRRLWAESDIRRRLHNELQELKGNIRVLARVRPVRSYPLPAAEPPPVPVVNVVQSDSLVDCQLSVFNAPRKTDVTFDFDCVFGGESTNADIFDEVSAGVWSALDGYNVSMLAYGQTGAGKTHTMNGTPEDRGVIFRAVSLLFEKIEQRREEGIDCVVRTSMVEVYNEAIHDLMAPPTRVGFVEQREKLELRTPSKSSGKGKKFTVEMQSEVVASSAEAWQRMEDGLAARAVGVTNVNDHSSRSHLIFTLSLEQQDTRRRRQTASKLVLVDLAGSERVGKSGATGTQLVEAQHINRSLSALGDVIAAIRAKQQHVPYRNSKLTALLADGLGGDAKAFLFAHVAPLEEHGAESLSTLAFAKRAAEVSLGKPVRRVVEPASKTQKLELQAAAEQAEAWQSRAHEAMAEAAIASSSQDAMMSELGSLREENAALLEMVAATPSAADRRAEPPTPLAAGWAEEGVPAPAPAPERSSTPEAIPPASPPPSPGRIGLQLQDIAQADRVEMISTRQRGTVRFVGTTALGRGAWVGIALDAAYAHTPDIMPVLVLGMSLMGSVRCCRCGKHDGSVGGRRYFSCEPGHGLLVKLKQVRKI